MNKLHLAALLFISLLAGCQKAEKEDLSREDNTVFLSDATIRFSATIKGAALSWLKGGDFYYTHSYSGGGNNQGAIAWFQLTNSPGKYLELRTPEVASLEELFSTALSAGTKQVCGEPSCFYMKVMLNDTLYTTAGPQTGSRLDILKTTLLNDNRRKTVWMAGDFKLYNAARNEVIDCKDARFVFEASIE